MGFVKGTDGIASTLRNTLEGSVGNIALENISAVTLTSTANITGGNITTAGLILATGNCTAGNISVTGTGNVTGNLVGRVMTALQPAITTLGTLTNMATNGNANVAQAVNSTTVVATGNVSGGNISTVGNITGNTAGFAIGYRDIPQVSLSANATIATADAGKHFYSTSASNLILTIANNASQAFETGSALTIINQGTGNITVAQGSGVSLYLAGNASSGNRTISTFGMATCIKVATNTWFINGTGVA